MFLTGVLQALIVLLLTAVFNVYIRVGVLMYDLQGVLFTCITIISASFMLLIYAGPGKLGISSFKNWATWGYGFCNIIQYILDIYLSKYVSATELSLFSRLTIPVSIIIALIFLKRKPAKMDILAILIILMGSCFLFYVQDASVLKTVVMLVSLAAIFFASEMFFAETHTQSAQANESGSMKDKARVVGFASFVTSLMFLILAMICAVLKDLFNFENIIVQSLPSLNEYFHLPTIISGLIYGSLIASVARYFTWSSTYKIKTENVLAVLVLVPITTYLLEILASYLLGLNINSNMFEGDRGKFVLLALVFMTIGSMLSIVPKVLKNINKQADQTWLEAFKESIKQQDNSYEIQHSAFDNSDYEVIKQTVAFYDNDIIKTAKLYNISEDAVKVILLAKGNNCFIDEISSKIQEIYKQEIVLKDKLTKAKNRMALTVDITAKIDDNETFEIALLDLNDFKPINDKYGHDAGDYILFRTVEKLQAQYGDNVYRLGGDEFVVLYDKINKQDILDAVSSKVKYKNKFLQISTSVGLTSFNTDNNTLDKLLKHADQLVYIDKKNK